MRKTFSFMLLASAAIGLAACGNSGSDSIPEGQTVARVDGKDVTIHELNAELRGVQMPTGEARKAIEQAALQRIIEYLSDYQVETKGVYIQDVQFPADIVEVLTTREIANQEKATFEEQQRAQLARIELEKTKGTADQQANLAASQVGITIKQNEADARKAQAGGEAGATVVLGEAEASKQRAVAIAQADAIRAQGTAKADAMRAQGEAQANTDRATGMAKADAAQALGLAQAAGYEAQRLALGEAATAAVNIVDAIGRGDFDGPAALTLILT